ncbi:MAG TPA: 30S ribosomal protein S8 [Deltaproteobacteria bacterium]|nr:30S ribosomal protein S8 [Deltaproteobacteria bacterium]
MMTDPVGDMLARIRNAGGARHAQMSCPASKLKLAVANVLSAEGFVGQVRTGGDAKKPTLTIELRYQDDGRLMIEGMRRVSKPGRRIYVGADEVKQVRSGLGMSVLSTSKGVLCDRDARAANVGGEVICEVW